MLQLCAINISRAIRGGKNSRMSKITLGKCKWVFFMLSAIDFSINGLFTEYRPNRPKIKLIDCFVDKNRVNWSNFNAMTLKFSEKFGLPFSHVFIFGNTFPECHGFIVSPVTNINTWENGWSNFLENLRIVAVKLLELTQFASPNHQFTLILFGIRRVKITKLK